MICLRPIANTPTGCSLPMIHAVKPRSQEVNARIKRIGETVENAQMQLPRALRSSAV